MRRAPEGVHEVYNRPNHRRPKGKTPQQGTSKLWSRITRRRGTEAA